MYGVLTMITMIVPFNSPFVKKYNSCMDDILIKTVNKLFENKKGFDDAQMLDCLQRVLLTYKGISKNDKPKIISVFWRHLKGQFKRSKIDESLFILGCAVSKNGIEMHFYEKSDIEECQKLLGYTYERT